MPSLTLRVVGSIHAIDAGAWNACHGASCPFLSWEFLALLEDCQAVSPQAVWSPAHAELSKGGSIVAYIPLYTLSGSAGSFVWDDGMEALARRVGSAWFPKLVAGVPFTPAPVWRPLVSPGQDENAVIEACIDAITQLAASGGFSGAHIHWPDPVIGRVLDPQVERSTLAEPCEGRDEVLNRGPYDEVGGWITWNRQVYRWENNGYGSFDDFTSSFSKNMRRNVARDKADVEAAGIRVRIVSGDESGPRMWSLMADYYEHTNDKFGPWAARFLPRSFFDMAEERIGRWVRFSAAYSDYADDPVAIAMLFKGNDTIWGRYWGASRYSPGLHFETCYYAPIAYAIREGLSVFDPGMGSHHKSRRGFKSFLSGSYHRVFDPRLRSVYSDALKKASLEESQFADLLNAELPFKKSI